MLRQRIIKPEILTDEKFCQLGDKEKLLFIFLWMMADEHGRMEYTPFSVKYNLLPAEDCTLLQISGKIGKICATGMIVVYTVGKKQYLQITNFGKHQRLDRRRPSKFPPISEGALFFPENPENPRQRIREVEVEREVRRKKEKESSSSPLTPNEVVDGGNGTTEKDATAFFEDDPEPTTETESVRIGTLVFAAAGIDSSKNMQATYRPVIDWLRAGYTEKQILAVVKAVTEKKRTIDKNWSPKTLSYFNQPMLETPELPPEITPEQKKREIDFLEKWGDDPRLVRFAKGNDLHGKFHEMTDSQIAEIFHDQ